MWAYTDRFASIFNVFKNETSFSFRFRQVEGKYCSFCFRDCESDSEAVRKIIEAARLFVEAVRVIKKPIRKIIEAVRLFVEAVRLPIEAERVLRSLANKSIPIDPRLRNNFLHSRFDPVKFRAIILFASISQSFGQA